ncbi:MAG: hypothetical protein Q9220_001529 [cf. Caloplaca sp. 1 TL-2023]
MSQGPSASRSSSSQRHNDKYKILPALDSRTLPPITDTSRPKLPHPGEYDASSKRGTPAQSPLNQKAPRLLGMQNILNPAAKDGSDEQNRRRKADQFDLPSPVTTVASRPPSTSMTPSPGSVSLPSITPPSMTTYLPPLGQGPRQLLSSRAASGYSQGPVTAIPATIDAKASPFLGSADSMNSGVPSRNQVSSELPSGNPLTTLPFANPLPSARSPPGRRPSGGSQYSAALERHPSLAGSDSPSTTYSSYSHFSRTPPAVPPGNAVNQPSSAYFGVPYPNPNTGPGLPHGFGTNGPVTSAMGQSPYQIMTLDTDQGPIQVPVDVQAASKVADEKRKRNATASHRFRQRRKEKERETSHNISKLETQIRDISDERELCRQEREYYRQERDYFRSLVCRNPSQAHLAARPPSPRHGKASTARPGSKEDYMGNQWQQACEDGTQSGRNIRRRTSSYVPSQDLPQSLSSGTGPQQPHQQQQQQQHPGYPQLQPAKLRSEGSQPQTTVHGRPYNPSAAPPDSASNWHLSRR